MSWILKGCCNFILPDCFYECNWGNQSLTHIEVFFDLKLFPEPSYIQNGIQDNRRLVRESVMGVSYFIYCFDFCWFVKSVYQLTLVKYGVIGEVLAPPTASLPQPPPSKTTMHFGWSDTKRKDWIKEPLHITETGWKSELTAMWTLSHVVHRRRSVFLNPFTFDPCRVHGSTVWYERVFLPFFFFFSPIEWLYF